MNTILLRIVLHGLIALVSTNTGTGPGVNHMTALLVDAHALPPGATDPRGCFTPHMPMLTVKPKVNADCTAIPGCGIVDTDCQCNLARQLVSLQVDPPLPDPAPWTDKAPGSFPLPFNFKEAASVNYVTNLTQRLGQALDSQFLAAVPPGNLAARMEFPFESIVACSLALRPDEGGRSVHATNFRSLGSLEMPGEVSQAVSQQVVTSLTIPVNANVILKIKNFDTGAELPMTLVPGADGYVIELANMRTGPDMEVDDPCDDGIGRDFAFFYDLTQSKPAWKERKLPHVKLTLWKSANDLQPQECLNLPVHKAPSSRPICPMGSFDPVVTP